ncbi:hypothetical protein HK405_005890 [Cladochytrium tenue]|nr:hypothetical protein HK405_005890 [Cladochytrium tenue]
MSHADQQKQKLKQKQQRRLVLATAAAATTTSMVPVKTVARFCSCAPRPMRALAAAATLLLLVLVVPCIFFLTNPNVQFRLATSPRSNNPRVVNSISAAGNPQSGTASLPPAFANASVAFLPRACDRYTMNGHLSSNSHLWTPFKLDFSSAGLNGTGLMKIPSIADTRRSCPSKLIANPTDHVGRLRSAASGGAWLPAHLRNRLVLAVGDSNDANVNDQLCRAVGGTSAVVDLDGSAAAAGPDAPCRQNARVCAVRDSAGAVFAWVSVTHYGVEMAAGRKNIYAAAACDGRPAADPDARLAWIPALLLGAARAYFPEICRNRDGRVSCGNAPAVPPSLHRRDPRRVGSPAKSRTNSPPPPPPLPPPEPPALDYYPVPDLVIAQSSLWDIREWQAYQGVAAGGPATELPWADVAATPGLMQSWLEKYVRRLVRPLHALLLPSLPDGAAAASLQQHRRGVPLMLRTCPLTATAHFQFPPRAVEEINQAVRDLAAHASDERWRLARSPRVPALPLAAAAAAAGPIAAGDSLFRGVLDWARILRGMDTLAADGFHHDSRGSLAFVQMALSELELLEFERGQAAA